MTAAVGRGHFLAAILLGLAGVAHAGESGSLKLPDAALEPLHWNELDGWSSDDHAAAFAALLASCGPILKGAKPLAGTELMSRSLHRVCGRAHGAGRLDSGKARTFFERNFRPARVSKLGASLGLLTGYYEPIVDGSRFPGPSFPVPMYRRPDDLAILAAGGQRGDFPNRAEVGRRIGDRVVAPYFDRAEIENGALDGRHLEICWLKDPIEAFSIHIQGSARVRLEDGLLLRLNYDAHNGFPFTPVGRILAERNLIPRQEMSMARIRKWMLANPADAREVRQANRSFIFFRITGLDDEGEPFGGEGVRLTPGRSIAVDKALHAYGTPFFVEADLPIDGDRSINPFRRLMIAQDTGSAIIGPARADIFFGAGDEAGRVAGRIRQMGRFAMLIPAEIDPAADTAHVPLPRPKPRMDREPHVAAVVLPRPRPKIGPDRSAHASGPAHANQAEAKNRPKRLSRHRRPRRQ